MEKKVKDIMIPIEGFPTVQAGGTIKDVVSVLGQIGSKDPCPGIVLVMENGKLAGTIGYREILQAVDPGMKDRTYCGWTISEYWSPPVFMRGLFTEKCHALTSRLTREVMRPVSRFLNAEDTIIKAVHTLLNDGSEAVPVWQNGTVAGMVGCANIFNEVAAIEQSADNGGRSRQLAV